MPTGDTRRIYSTGLLVMFPLVYFAHLVDERYYWIGTAEFATRYLGIYFTNGAWWLVNVPSLVLLTAAAVLVARVPGPNGWGPHSGSTWHFTGWDAFRPRCGPPRSHPV